MTDAIKSNLSQLHYAIARRDLKHVKQILTTAHSNPDVTIKDIIVWFRYMCNTGWLEGAQRMTIVIPQIRSYFINTTGAITIDAVFESVCDGGHLKVAQWIYATFPGVKLRRGEVPHFQTNVELILWLLNTFPRYYKKLKVQVIFEHICVYGTLEELMQLMRAFPNRINVRTDNYVFRTVCHTNQFDKMCWLLTYYTAKQFWTDEVQNSMRQMLTEYHQEMAPKRADFMANITPYLPCPRI